MQHRLHCLQSSSSEAGVSVVVLEQDTAVALEQHEVGDVLSPAGTIDFMTQQHSGITAASSSRMHRAARPRRMECMTLESTSACHRLQGAI